ncbi:MAG TPA: hypothetical protein VGB98_02665 [Pyrinomonadaceae bacterium]|jgi:hypothetical protein
MRLLLSGRLAPITSTVGFLEAPLAGAVGAFVDWQRSIYEPKGISVTHRPVTGGLEEVLLSLLPLTSVLRRRYLFVPTESPWVAFFDNGHGGTDAFSVMSTLAQLLRCRGMRVTAIPDTIEGEFKEAKGRHGGLVLEVYGPDQTHFLNYVRSISVVNDGGKWDFNQGGTPFPFEDLSRYKARRVRDRFTFDMLESYLSELGVSPFKEEFYLPASGGAAQLVEKHGLTPPGMRKYTLAEAAGNS